MQRAKVNSYAPKPMKAMRYLLFLVPLAIVVLVALSRRNDEMHIDEVYWIGQSYYYNLAFIEKDLRHPDWKLLPA